MSSIFDHFSEEQKEALSRRVKSVSQAEASDWFEEDEQKGVVKFHALVKSERSRADVLDIDLDASEERIRELESEELEDEDLLRSRDLIRENISAFQTMPITLIAPKDFDYEPKISEKDKKAARPIEEDLLPLAEYFAEDKIAGQEAARSVVEASAETAGLPAVVDNRDVQSAIKNQAGRGTCVSHASCACLEAFAHIPDDLSEQYAHYKFNEFMNRPHDRDQGLKTTDSAKYLARDTGRVCREQDWPYIPDQESIDDQVDAGTYAPPPEAERNQLFGIGSYKIITDRGLTGESIKNTRYLEALVYQGYDIVIGTWVAWRDVDNDGILDPRFQDGQPIYRGGHAMLVVGYNRNDQYFILKNSWSEGWGHDGYGFLSYDYVRTYFKYGYVVKSVVPAEPNPLPTKLTGAPFGTDRIGRGRLRASVLAFKTSQGRYAVCEAYAGYNLYLKNLVVYNADGTERLRKDRLVVRGTFLCDIDSGRETSSDADFWWQAVRPGVNYLVPRNGAQAVVLYDLAALSAARIKGLDLSSSPVPAQRLHFAVVAGLTTANRPFKMLVHARPGNKLRISYLEVFHDNGNRYRYAQDIDIASSWTYNLDTQNQGGGRFADIWWHVVSDNAAYLEGFSRAKITLAFFL